MTAEDGEDIAEMSSYRRVEFDGDMLSPSITRTAPEATGEFETDSPYEETVRSPHGLQQPTGRSEFGLSPSTTKSSKSIRLEPPPVVMRPPKVKDGGFGQAALSWISWYRNEETDVPDCARCMRRSYHNRTTFRFFGLTIIKDINWRTSETGVDAAIGSIRLTWGKSEVNWVFDRLPEIRRRMGRFTETAEETAIDEETQNASGHDHSSTTAVENTHAKDPGRVPHVAHAWLSEYYYVVVGFRGEESVPKETLRRVRRIDGLFQQIRTAQRHLRYPLRRLFSLKEVYGFGIYQCDPSKGYHREMELDGETESALAEMWRSYKGHKLDYEGRWLLWIHQHFNNSSKNPELGSLTLEFKLRWSIYKVIIWGLVPILLSLGVGFWYMYKDHGDTDPVHVAEAAWGIATYIITTSALMFALLAVITQLGDI